MFNLSKEIPESSWENRPSVGSFKGLIKFTNIGNVGSIWYSNGIDYAPVGYINLSHTVIPSGVPSSGSVANNGALTLTTALNSIYPSIYLYFPAGALYAGSVAGLYYTVMSSTTVGTVYGNTYTSENPTVPASPTGIVATGPGAYTQTTGSRITCISNTIKGGLMGDYAKIRPSMAASVFSSGTAKTLTIYVNSTSLYSSIFQSIRSVTTCEVMFVNKGGTNSQLCNAINQPAGIGSTASEFTYTSIDTTADFNVSFGIQLATATDWVIMADTFIRLEN